MGVIMDSPRQPEKIIQISTNDNWLFALSNYHRIYYRCGGAWKLVQEINFEEINDDK